MAAKDAALESISPNPLYPDSYSMSPIPMSWWKEDALISLEEDLKLNINLVDLMGHLQQPAGGFMTEDEKMSVCEQPDQREKVGCIINLLRTKSDREFDIFTESLKKTGHKVWAEQLESTAERLKDQEVKQLEGAGQVEDRMRQLEDRMGQLEQNVEQRRIKAQGVKGAMKKVISRGQLEYDFIYKVVLLGSPNVGKSCILSRFVKDKFSLRTTTTIGVDIETKFMNIDSKVIKVQVWDTAGQERYDSITSLYYRGAVGAILVYDITNHFTYSMVECWLKELRHYNLNKNLVIMLVGNKCDLQQDRAVTLAEAQAYSREKCMLFYETSAKDGTCVQDAFYAFVTEIYQSMISNTNTPISQRASIVSVAQPPLPQPRPRKCCRRT